MSGVVTFSRWLENEKELRRNAMELYIHMSMLSLYLVT